MNDTTADPRSFSRDSDFAQQLRVQLQDLMMGLLDLAGGARQNPNNNPPPAAPAQAPAEVVVDPALIQQLVDMGFAQNRSRKALILSRLNLQRAMEWLLEHENDPVRSFFRPLAFGSFRTDSGLNRILMLRSRLVRRCPRRPQVQSPTPRLYSVCKRYRIRCAGSISLTWTSDGLFCGGRAAGTPGHQLQLRSCVRMAIGRQRRRRRCSGR